MRERAWPLALVVPAGVAVAVLVGVPGASIGPGWWLAVAAMGAGALLPVPSVAGRRLDAGYAVAAAMPFLFPGPDGGLDLRLVAGGLAAGLTVQGAVWVMRGGTERVIGPRIARRMAGFSCWVAVFWGLEQALDGSLARVAAPLAAAVGWYVVEVGVSVVVHTGPDGPARRYAARLAIREVDAFLGLTATGALFGLTFPEIGWWALLVAGLPYAFAHTAFVRLDATKQTYRQTIRALARIPEVSGLGEPGHADRTARLAVETAKALGLRPGQVDEVEFAAVMHDLGRISLNEPAVIRMGYTDDDIARWGAEIIGETAYLTRVAEVVRRQYEPYRSPGQGRDPELPLAARIVRAASAYQVLVEHGRSPLEAMERLHESTTYDYDPDVVAALRGVLERQGAFRPAAHGRAG
jgi:hypothetical protein